VNKRKSQEPNYFVENGTIKEDTSQKKERESYSRLEIEKEDRYIKRIPTIIRYKIKIKRIDE
jgi:hypothetical protein